MLPPPLWGRGGRGDSTQPPRPLTIRQGYRIVTLLGVFLFGIGALAVLGSFRAGASPLDPASAFGALFILLGLVFALGWGSVTVDAVSRTVAERKGLFGLFSRRSHPFSDFSRIHLSRKVTSLGEDSTRTTYPVTLEGARRLKVDRFETYAGARRCAEEVAGAMELDLRDSTEGRSKVRAARDLDRPLRALGRTPPPGPPPPGRLAAFDEGEAYRVEIGPAGLNWMNGVAPVLVATGAVWLALAHPGPSVVPFLANLAAFLRRPGPDADMIISLFCILGASLVAAVPLLDGLRGREILRVEGDFLRWKKGFLVYLRRSRVPLDEIEELDASEGEYDLYVRGNWGTLRFGAGLKEKERVWLARALRHHASAPRKT